MESSPIKAKAKSSSAPYWKQIHDLQNLMNSMAVEEEDNDQELGFEYNDEQVQYFPPELIHYHSNESETLYHCYLVELRNSFYRDTRLRDVLLAVRSTFDFHDESMALDLVDGSISPAICTRYVGAIRLTSEQVLICRRFQVTLLRILLDHNLNKLNEALGAFDRKSDFLAVDYLLLPAAASNENQLIDWYSVCSVLLPSKNTVNFCARDCGQRVYTKSGLVCRCVLQNSLVCTPHNGSVYHVAGTLEGLNGKSSLKLRGGEVTSYQNYFEKRHDIRLQYEGQSFLHGRHVTTVQNYLLKCRKLKTKEPSNASVELPPELCLIIMSPISLATLYSFSFAPSIMHRIESLLLAANLKKMHMDHCTKNVIIPTNKVLEAITTKECQENLHLESLETLGDAFLKYTTSQQLFKTYQEHNEGLLSKKREKIISNTALCKLGCNRKIPGFIRNEPFDLKTWIVPGDNSVVYALEEEELSPTKKIHIRGRTKIKSKRVADVVEALIGAFLSEGGEMAALSFMEWLGIKVDFVNDPCVRQYAIHPEAHRNIRSLESLLNYSFRDASLLVEALTHDSYMSGILRCYQRLEFLGDAVLDYLITVHLYKKYPSLSPGVLTDLRSASVNNDCYAQSAVRAGLYKHILLASPGLQRQVATAVRDFDQLSLASTFGWDSETAFPKVLGDIIESLCGAIFVDSNYNKECVFESIRPQLEPLITPDTLKLHPVRELTELCQKNHYKIMWGKQTRERDLTSVTVEVKANGITYRNSASSSNKDTARKVACKGLLKSLKDDMVSIRTKNST